MGDNTVISPQPEKTKLHYGFIVVIVALLVGFASQGLFNNLRTYTSMICETYGFARGDYMLMFSFESFTDMIVNLFLWSFLYKKLGARLYQSLGAFAMTAAFFIFSKATSLPLFYVAGF